MKLVIEIPDSVYKNCCKIPLNSVERAVKNGTPLDSVLDKIRAEIEQVVAEESTEDLRWASGLKYSIKIIDKHKSESEVRNEHTRRPAPI